MTMLDRMRRHRGWLKWSLGIVVVTFVLLYIPAFLNEKDSAGINSRDVLASVNGHDVTMAQYQRLYQDQLQRMRASYGGSIDEAMLKQLGIGQNILQSLIAEQAKVAEAERLGITVSDGELRERITRMPGFQENGQFIGEQRYNELLMRQRPPIRPADFEEDYRHALMGEKLEQAVSGWVRVSDTEVDSEYRKRNEKVKAEVAVFNASSFRSGITPTDAEIGAQFAAHTDTYKIPEKRRVKFLSIDAESLRSKMTVTPQEVEAKYNSSQAAFSTPEQVRASHILIKGDDKDKAKDAAAKKKAEDILAKVKAGSDFAALAKQYSEDDSNKNQGGDLDFFPRGRMDTEFEKVAFALQAGQVSDLVKSAYGYHIIKLTGRRPAATKTLADVRGQIEEQLKFEKAQLEAQKVAGDIAKDVKTPDDLDRVARTRGMTVGDSGLFAREEPLAGLGFAPAVASEAFTQTQGKVSGLLQTNQGLAIIAVTEIKPSYVPKLDEVKEKVKEDVIRLKSVDVAKAKAQAVSKATGAGFAAAAKAAGVEVKTTDFIGRGSALPEVGVSPDVDGVLFGLKTGETSAPIPTDNAVVVAHVKERQDVDQTKFLAERDTLKSELLTQRRQEFFSAYMAKAKPNLKVAFNENAIKTLFGQ